MTKAEYKELVKQLHIEWELENITDDQFLSCLVELKNELPKTKPVKTTLKRFFR